MQKTLKYMDTYASNRRTIFKTKWGYFGLVGAEYGLLRTHLPGPKPEKIKPQLLKNLSVKTACRTQFDKTLFKTTQEQIAAYFEGTRVNFSPAVCLTN